MKLAINFFLFFHSFSEFERNFDGDDWGTNGPGVITRVLQNVCHTKKPFEMSPENCRGMNVYPPSSFYAIPWQKWHWFFDSQYTKKALQVIKDSPVIHVWNKHSTKEKIRVGSSVAYGIAAEQHCPAVYGSCGKYF